MICTDLDRANLSPQINYELTDQMCDDRDKKPILLQGASEFSKNQLFGKRSYYLTVDTCYRQQQLYPDKKFDCFEEQDSFDIITSVHIETKTAVEFFSPANYQAKNKKRAVYEFKTRR